MELVITPATPEEKSILRNLMELYLYDFTEFDAAEIGANGRYGYIYLDSYWNDDPQRHPFLVRVDGNLAGFVLVCRYNYLDIAFDHWVIAEFFILRKYRGRGIGAQVAAHIFSLFPGPWQVGQIAQNTPATAFWRKVIGRFTNNHYEEVFLDNANWHGPVQMFISAPEQEN